MSAAMFGDLYAEFVDLGESVEHAVRQLVEKRRAAVIRLIVPVLVLEPVEMLAADDERNAQIG